MLDTTNLLLARLGKTKSTNLYCLFAAALDDEDVGALVVAGLVSAGGLAPGSDGMPSARGLAFTTAVRVVDGVHGDAAVGGANTFPAVASGLAYGDCLMVGVADLADGG